MNPSSLKLRRARVLIITGDKNFAASERFRLQASQIEKLEALYFGRGALMPKVPREIFDVVTTQDPFWRGIFAWWLAWRMGARLNIQVHTDLSAQNFFRRALARLVLRRADSVRVVSEKIKKQVEQFGVRSPIFVLPIYIDISKLRRIGRSPDKTSGFQKTIVWIGRFEKEKDPLAALGVFDRVRSSGIDAKLVMLGTGSLESALRAQAENLPIEFPGWKDPAAYLAGADIVLCTSRHESFGASIIEALAAGVPVVAPDVGVAREAGAIIAPRSNLWEAVLETLRSGAHGELKITLLNADEWTRKWKETL